MVTLPYKPLSNIDLHHYALQLRIPHFRGVYMCDTLPKRPLENESCIVNLEPSSRSGSHWVAIHKRGKHAYYFDSYGDLRPPREIKLYLRDCSSIQYNYERYQSFNSVICGHLCLQFLLTINSIDVH